MTLHTGLNWTLYNAARQSMLDGTIDFDTNAFRISLHPATASAVIEDLTKSVYTDVNGANELSTLYGYTAGGYTPTIGLTRVGAVTTINSTNPNWTASGSPIQAKYAVLRKYTGTPATEVLVAYAKLNQAADNGPQATAGKVFTVKCEAGILSLVP